MLLFENSIRQCFDGVVGQNGDGGLGDDGAGVEFLGYDVDGAAADLDAGAEGLGLRDGGHAAGEGGEQGRVDVEDAVGVGGDDEGAEDGVEAGQGDEVGAGVLQDFEHAALLGGA